MSLSGEGGEEDVRPMSARGISQDPRQQWAGGCKLRVKGNKGLLNVWPEMIMAGYTARDRR